MKITGIDLKVVEYPNSYQGAAGQQVVLIDVKTDEGIDGYSMGWGVRGGVRTAEEIAAVIRPQLIGEDPIDRERIYHKIEKADRWGGQLPFSTYGPVDVALWDITAKKAGLPLYKFIGGYRDRMPAYATGPAYPSPEDYVKEGLLAKKLGFRGYKLHPPGKADLDIECCRRVREAVGPDFPLMSDPVGAYNFEEAMRVGRALEKLGFLWYEEPLYDYEIHNYVRLTQALDIPVVACEWVAGRYHLAAEYIVRGAVDAVRSDVAWKGGFTGYLKTAHLCEAFGLNCEIHFGSYSLLNLANLHAACGVKNCTYLELVTEMNNFGIKPSVMKLDSEGFVHAPNKPGLGVEIDWDVIEPNVVRKI